MAEAGELSVLQRKVNAAQPGPVLSAMTVQKAVRLAVARAAEQILGCPVSLSDLSETRGPPDELTDGLPDPALLLRLNGMGAECGLAVFCPQAVAAVIEAQTTGRISNAKAADRKPTRTDAVMVSEFLDLVLLGIAAWSADCPKPPPVAGFLCGGPEADMRTAVMALREAEHLNITIAMDFGNGAKAGTLNLLLPSAPAEFAPGPVTSDWGRNLGNAVMGSTARLEAVLCRQRMPLSRLTALAVGDVVQLDTASLNRVALCGSGGKTLLYARLGRSGTARALRLELDGGGAVAPTQTMAPALAAKAPDSASGRD